MPAPSPPRPAPSHPPWTWAPALVLAAALAWAWTDTPALAAQDADDPARQVTLFGVIASPFDMSIDPKLVRVSPQLRKLLPDHGFRLLGVQSKRLTEGGIVSCPLEAGFSSSATLLEASDANGKVRIRCAVLQNQAVRLESVVTTPPNQLFFCEKGLPDGTRLLVGIGAR